MFWSVSFMLIVFNVSMISFNIGANSFIIVNISVIPLRDVSVAVGLGWELTGVECSLPKLMLSEVFVRLLF